MIKDDSLDLFADRESPWEDLGGGKPYSPSKVSVKIPRRPFNPTYKVNDLRSWLIDFYVMNPEIRTPKGLRQMDLQTARGTFEELKTTYGFRNSDAYEVHYKFRI